ncbi:MAG: ribosomal protein S18-alanine N-acetyltransferase [Bryobacteraceae bacterium]
MTQTIRIAPFTPRQMAAVMRIERASFGRGAYPERLFRDLHRDCGDLFFTARVGRRVAAYAVSSVREDTGEIISLAVDPQARGMGLGRALLAHTLGKLAQYGAARAELAVRPGNEAALALYKSVGFRRVGLVRRYYEDGGDAWLMRRRLER